MTKKDFELRLLRSSGAHRRLYFGYQLITLVHETNATGKLICMRTSMDKPIPANTEFLQRPL